MTTLQIKYGTDIKSESFIIDAENSEQQIYNFTVIVDGSENIAHFTVSNNSSYVEIKQMRNEITVVVKPNLTKDERLNSITFTHNMDSSIVFVVTIKQRARVYGIFVDKLNIQFNPL